MPTKKKRLDREMAATSKFESQANKMLVEMQERDRTLRKNNRAWQKEMREHRVAFRKEMREIAAIQRETHKILKAWIESTRRGSDCHTRRPVDLQ